MAKGASERAQVRAELRAALALRRETIGHFAAQCGVTRTHFDMVLRGTRESMRVDRLIAARIQEFRDEMKQRARKSRAAA